MKLNSSALSYSICFTNYSSTSCYVEPVLENNFVRCFPSFFPIEIYVGFHAQIGRKRSENLKKGQIKSTRGRKKRIVYEDKASRESEIIKVVCRFDNSFRSEATREYNIRYEEGR